MKIPRIGYLQRAVRQIKKRFASRALILMYHRVAEVGSDPWSLCVKPRHFGEHLEVLQKYGRPMQLQQLVQALRDGNLPHRAVAITFDDGYADNLYNAKPLLESYNIPATVFLTTGYIRCDREFWWDELDRILLQPGILPKKICLKIDGTTHQWELGEASYYNEDEYQRCRHLKAWDGKPGSRHFLCYSLWHLLHPLPEDERRKALNEIMTWASTEPAIRPAYRSLSLEEVGTITQGKLVEVGAHSVTHPNLSKLTVASQLDEIQRSKAYLEEILDRPVTSFAYPYGCYTV